MRPDDADMPRALRTRPKDRRGYPVPWIVLVDSNGRAHFTINNGQRTVLCGRKRLCGLCGKKLRGEAAFIGGPVCFLSPRGAFSDPPMHAECARYAVRVCPYIAAPSYAKRIDDRTLQPGAVPGGFMIGHDDAVRDDRPGLFMLGVATRSEMIIRDDGAPLFFGRGRWEHIEGWRHGVQLGDGELARAVEDDKPRWPTS